MQIYAFFANRLPDPVYDNYRKKLFLNIDFHCIQHAADLIITVSPALENKLYS